jgi:hypothetical protein
MAWESLVQIAVVLQCLNASLNKIPFILGSVKIIENPLELAVNILDIPIEYSSLVEAEKFVNSEIEKCTEATVVFFIPKHPQFEAVDGLLCYVQKQSKIKSIYGIQAKIGRGAPSGDGPHPPPWVAHSFLVRGDPASTRWTRKEGWSYLSDADVKALLGYSLSKVYPKEWSNVSSVKSMNPASSSVTDEISEPCPDLQSLKRAKINA